jgi:acyl-coenzyme A synthetase/AMP-(fatty) acid ligase
VQVVNSIFAQARATPDKTAVVQNGRALSYGAFAACIVLARRFLESRDLNRDLVAVLCIHSLPDMWIIDLALRSLGVTTLHSLSVADIERLGLGAVTVISTEVEAWPSLATAAARTGSTLIAAPADIYAGATAVEIEKAAPTATAPGGHILLTSGTTGVYKKVLIDAAVEARRTLLCADRYGVMSTSVVNVFDLGGWTAVGYNLAVCTWSFGGSVVIHQGPNPWRSLAAPGLTHAFVHPQLLADLLAAPAEVPLRNDAMAVIVTAGVLSPAQWRAARERLTRDVRTSIGSTETAGFAVTRIETPQDLVWHRVYPAHQVEVVDEQDGLLPAGKTGIVRVRTTGIDGYLDDPAATRAFFRDDHFYPGDLGILGDDGRLSLLGRVTNVINVMGHKRATTPIETALQDRLGAEAVCVFSVPSDGGEDVHVAIQPGGVISPEDLRAALAAALPGVAQVCVHAVKAFPRNHMGKIERAALKARLLSEGVPPEP